MSRRALPIIGLTLLLTSCFAGSKPVPAGMPCETATFSVVDDFVAARRGSCLLLDNNHVELDMRPEHENVINPSAWYAFKLLPNETTTAIVTLRYSEAYHRYSPKTSSDGILWTRLDEQLVSIASDGMSATLTLELGDEPLWVSAQELMTPDKYEVWVDSMAQHDEASLELLGHSKAGREIELLSVNSSAKDVLFLAGRQHPPEVSGGYAFLAFYETLLAETPLAIRFRERFQIIAIPLLNPDGVIAGHWRNNLRGMDLNRDWGPFTQPETQAIRDLLNQLDSEGKNIRVFLDFHSTDRNVFYVQNDENPTEPRRFTTTWLENARPHIRDYEFGVEENPVDKIGVSKNYMYKRYGIPSSTYEVGDETDEEPAGAAAMIFAEELMKLMLEQDYS